jgi:hypothetical protein
MKDPVLRQQTCIAPRVQMFKLMYQSPDISNTIVVSV